ncbi:MAG: STY0301 family protein [Candidatus Korobacteraceae bacterium]|jgi:hypothetical protein
MSSIERCLRLGLLGCSLAFSASAAGHAQQKQISTPAVCPASITVEETTAPAPNWSVAPAKSEHNFERISVYNVGADGQEFDLAPDDQKEKGKKITQTWNVKDYRSLKVFMRCRYQDTSVVLLRELPSAVTTCTLRFTDAANGIVAGESSMECR